MKTNDIKKTIVAITAALAFVASSSALPEAQVAALKKAFKNVPATEMAAKAADIVSNTTTKERVNVAVEVIKIVAAKKPAVAASAVAAISIIAPEVASATAATAASLSKEYAENIALAAAKAAPQYSGTIYQSVAQAVPSVAAKLAQLPIPANNDTGAGTISAAAGTSIVPGHITLKDPNEPPPNYSGDASSGYDPTRPVVPPYSQP